MSSGAFEPRPEGGGVSPLFRTGDEVDCFDGEEAP